MPKLCFHHIPKTAGTTINRLLDANHPNANRIDAYEATDYSRLEAIEPETLRESDIIRGHFLLKDFPGFQALIPEHRIITLLRDPVRRVVSEFYWLKHWPHGHLYARINEEKLSLENFVTSQERHYRFRGKNLMTTWCSGISAVDEPERALETALANIESVHAMVGIVERFDESLLLMQPLLQLTNPLYERQNVQRREEEANVSEATLSMIAELNQLDLQLYQRAEALLEARIASQGEAFTTRLWQFRKANASYQKVARLIMQQHSPGALQGAFLNGK